MKKYKRHIIIGSIIIAVLVFAFWWGGDAPSLRGWNVIKSVVLFRTLMVQCFKVEMLLT